MSRKQRAAAPEAPTAEPKPSKRERAKYDPKLCAKVERLGAEGKSAAEIRRELGISRSTWRAWVKKHPSGSPRRRGGRRRR